MTQFAKRRDKLRRKMRRERVDGMLVTNFVNVTYLTGFTGDDSYLLLTDGDALLLSDARYEQQIAEECPDVDAEIRRPPKTMMQVAKKVVPRAGVQRLAIEADSVTLSLHGQLQQALPKCELVQVSGWLQRLREIKDRQEIEAIRRSLAVAERAFEVVKASLRGDQTERDVAFALEHQIRLFGGDRCSFRPIVAVGPRAALPHAVPTSARMRDGDFVLLDWGASVGGYLSDLTRVLVTGKISPKLERIYGVVLKAQQQAIKAVRDGALMSDVDAAARQVIADAGFDRRFGHGLGHGFGLEIHESPRLAPLQDRKLRAGMVITIEPGIYLPGFGGVRIEDDILVTRSGHEVLSKVPKSLAECTVRWTD